jgi:hypothetical protein
MDNLNLLSKIRLLSFQNRCHILLWVSLGVITCFAFLPRMAQDPAYHLFADRREILGIPNFLDVFSNIPFFAASMLGFLRMRRMNWPKGARRSYLFFLFGIGMTCVGSIYYHLRPTVESLFWDRLPMTIGFMGFLCTLISLRVSERWALRLLAPLLIFGFLSVLYWSYSESLGAGDLRPYLLVQFGMILISILLLVLFPEGQPPLAAVCILFGAYFLAKLFEGFDLKVFELSGRALSGHTLKHLLAGIGCYLFIYSVSQPTTRPPSK